MNRMMVGIALLAASVSAHATDAPSMVVSNFLAAMEFGTNDVFAAYVAPSADGQESRFIRDGRAMGAEFTSHQNAFEIIGAQSVTGFAVVVCNIFSNEKPKGSPNAFYLVLRGSRWLLLPDAIDAWSNANLGYVQGKEEVLRQLELDSRTLWKRAEEVEQARRQRLQK